jgi:hypothetical protein
MIDKSAWRRGGRRCQADTINYSVRPGSLATLVAGWWRHTRETAVGLTDLRLRTHPEFRPAGATRCQSLLFAGEAILWPDLHEWLFLLVTT